MKIITYHDILSFNPCYDPIKYLPKTWKGSLIDLLKMKQIPAKDRLWVCVRHELMSDLQLKYYGLEVAKACRKNTKDKRIHDCLKITALFLKGKVTLEELKSAARSAARSAAWSAAWSAESAAWSARSAAEEKQCKILIKILKTID